MTFFAVGMALAVASVSRETAGTTGPVLRHLVDRPTLAWGLAALCYVLAAEVCGVFGGYALPLVGALSFQQRFVGNDLLQCAFLPLALIPAAFPARGREGLAQRVLGLKPVAFAGVVSYATYLWHAPVGLWLSTLPPIRHQLTTGSVMGFRFAMIATALPLAMLVGTLSYLIVELPFLRLKRGWIPTRDRRGAQKRASPSAVQEPT
jgi:peptidoglycan/LPS O-acetylase OafA/YrhL